MSAFTISLCLNSQSDASALSLHLLILLMDLSNQLAWNDSSLCDFPVNIPICVLQENDLSADYAITERYSLVSLWMLMTRNKVLTKVFNDKKPSLSTDWQYKSMLFISFCHFFLILFMHVLLEAHFSESQWFVNVGMCLCVCVCAQNVYVCLCIMFFPSSLSILITSSCILLPVAII